MHAHLELAVEVGAPGQFVGLGGEVTLFGTAFMPADR